MGRDKQDRADLLGLLYVDVDDQGREFVRRSLARLSFPLQVTTDPEQALTFLEEQACSVVVAPLELGAINGVQFLEQVRHRWPATVRILCVRDLSVEMAQQAVNRAEVYRLLPQPCDPGLLQQTVVVAHERFLADRQDRERWNLRTAKESTLAYLAHQGLAAKVDVQRPSSVPGAVARPSSVRNVASTPPNAGREDRGVVGKGGMAAVSRVFDPVLQREVAEKRLLEIFQYAKKLANALVREAQLTAQLQHPHIVPVHDLRHDSKVGPIFSMKLVEGRTFKELLEDCPPRGRTNAQLFQLLQVFLRVCDAVAFAHSQGVIHQDLKPSNIMVGPYGEVYVMDWGIAARLDEGKVVPEGDEQVVGSSGTPGFMAPEQALGCPDGLDIRSDVFSLGAMLYVVLTGLQPYRGATVQETLVKTVTEPPPSPADVCPDKMPPQLCTIALRALSRQREDRHATVSELKEEIERFLQSGWQFQVRVYGRGQIILREGDAADEAFVLVEGQCEAFKHKGQGDEEVRLNVMGPGEAFGETALLTGKRRSASVRALTDATTIVVGQEQLDEELGDGFFLGPLLRGLAVRFHQREDQASQLERQSTAQRWSIHILRHLAQQGHAGGQVPEVPFSQLCDIMAEHFQTTRADSEERIRALDGFVVDEERGRLRIKD
jgi:serine/threonine-protein kinase